MSPTLSRETQPTLQRITAAAMVLTTANRNHFILLYRTLPHRSGMATSLHMPQMDHAPPAMNDSPLPASSTGVVLRETSLIYPPPTVTQPTSSNTIIYGLYFQEFRIRLTFKCLFKGTLLHPLHSGASKSPTHQRRRTYNPADFHRSTLNYHHRFGPSVRSHPLIWTMLAKRQVSHGMITIYCITCHQPRPQLGEQKEIRSQANNQVDLKFRR